MSIECKIERDMLSYFFYWDKDFWAIQLNWKKARFTEETKTVCNKSRSLKGYSASPSASYICGIFDILLSLIQ